MKKTLFIESILIIAIVAILPVFPASAQDEVVKETRDVPSFNKIDVGGAFEVTLTQGSPQMVTVEVKQKYLENITTEVEENMLVISSHGIKSNTPLKVYITVPEITRIIAHGAAELNGDGPISAGELVIEASGAAEVDLQVEANKLITDVSGAAELDLAGTCENHETTVSGAASLNAGKLLAKFTQADVSGAASAHVNAENLVGNTSGAGELYDNDGPVKDDDWDEADYIVDADDDDTTYIKVPGAAVVVTENNDSVTIKLGNRILVVDEDGDVEYKRCSKPRFNGHWAGVDLGFNGYVNSDFNMNFPPENEYMDLRMEKSANVNLNFFEQNIRLAKNQHWGIVTGLGLSFNDYKFQNQTRLRMDTTFLQGYIDEGISIKKTKLSMYYLTLPVLFEFQTAPAYNKNGFHINAGVIIGARLSSHTKIYYNELNKEFDITQYNPETGRYEVVFTAISPEDPKQKNYDDWYLQPFKFDASFRIGWNFLNFYVTYSLNTMFRQDKGPELYPWSAGITLVAF